MVKEWKSYKLQDIVDQERGISYGVVQPGNHVPEGVPILKVNNLTNKSFDLKELQFISKSIEEKYQRTRLKGGELLISLVGSLGEVYIVPPNMIGMNVVRALAVVPVLQEFSPEWVKYWLKAPVAQNLLRQIATTSVQATINLKELREIEVPFPEIKEREDIASILSALDDKIELNLQMNKTLEEMAMALYKHWFVDFGPLKNGEFVTSELGAIPKGWLIKSVYEVAEYINGAAFKPSDFDDNGLFVIKIAELKNGISSNTNRSSKSIKDDLILKNGSVLFSWSASLDVFIWDKGKALLNQHIFNVLPNGNMPVEIIYFMLKYEVAGFQSIAAGRATTMGHITLAHLKEALLVIPDKKSITKISPLFKAFYDTILNNLLETQTLTTLRDTLLPKLISGEVRVKDAARSLAEVL